MTKKYSLSKNSKRNNSIANQLNYHNYSRGKNLSQLINVGPRYVFFNSLTSSGPAYSQLYGIGQGYLSQVTSQLSQAKNINTGQQINRMTAYVNFISSMATSQGNNLNKFLQKMKNQLSKSSTLSQELQAHFEKYFNDFQASGGTNYEEMIALINEVMQRNNQNQKEIDESYLQRAKIIETAITKLEKNRKKERQQNNSQQKLSQLFHTNINAYNIEINKIANEALANSDFKVNYARLMAQKINGIISQLVGKSEFLSAIEQGYVNNFSGSSPKDFSNRLISFITQYLSNLSMSQLSSSSSKDLATTIISELQNNYKNKLSSINDNFISLIENQFMEKKANRESQSIEELALTTGQGTARLFLKIKDKENDVIKPYLEDTLEDKELEYIKKISESRQKTFSTGKLSYISRILNKGIRKKLEQQLNKDVIDSIRNKTIEASSVLKKMTYSSSIIEQALSVKVSGSSASEILTGKDFANEVALAIQSGGHVIKLKNDINVIVNFNEEQFSQKADIQLELKDIAISFQSGFINKYLQQGKGTEDVQAAADAYLNQLKEVKKRLDELVKQRKIKRKQANEFLKNLSELMQIGISVKDYSAGNNLGFHGGTLGSNLQGVINNINTMYNLGGISKIDADLLYFAIANCGPDAIASGLKESIETYLAGAAAIMMFDQGFTTAENFMARMKAQLGGFDSMSTVHLFRVQGKLIPAAVVYGIISQNLSSVIGDLGSQSQQALENGGNYVTINNTISHSSIPSYYEMPNPQSRWDAVSSLASNVLSGSNISFTFLAGIIDILESIPKAFDI